MIEKFLTEIWAVVLELGFPLILGMTIAGGLHVLLPAGFVHRNFGGRGLKSVFMASLIGVPMPLCSCGVIPTAIGLKKDGASNGAATSFLISTPQTGVDSILVSATFLGWPFAIFKVIVAFITGIFGGSAVDFIERNQKIEKRQFDDRPVVKGFWPKLKEAVNFSLFELLGMIYGWIIFGVIVAALITTFVPPGYLAGISWINGIGGLFLMLLIALPLYVCATASVPIAASLIIAGMPPGAALVFLMAGPATNVATIGALYRVFGKKVVGVYLATVAVFSIFFGWLFDFILGPGLNSAIHTHHERNLFYIIFAAILIGLLGYLVLVDLKKKLIRKSPANAEENKLRLKVTGMTCQHCAANVTRAIESVPGVIKVRVSLEDSTAYIDGDADKNKLIDSIKNAGYEASV